MRKLFYTLGTIAAVAFVLTSCERQEVSNPDDNLVTITLKADKAGVNTKTSAVEGDEIVSYKWTAEDVENMKLFVVGLDDKGKETFTVVESAVLKISEDSKILSITATVPSNSVVRAVLAGEWTNDGTKPKVKAIQSPLAYNFDPNADVLVSDDVTVSGLNEALLTFRRPVTVSKMTLRNLAEGEKVDKVTISSATNLTGYYEYTNAAMSGQNPEITLKYDDVEVDSTGEFPVYFVAMPNTGHTLTVIVKTDQNTYSKTFGNGTIDFNLGEFTKFSVNMSGCAVDESDYSGEWIIGGASSNSALAATAYSSGDFYPVSSVSIEGDVVTVTGSAASLKMTIARVTEGDNAGLYTIVDANGNYLSATGGSSNFMTGLTAPDATTSYWSIEENTDGTFNILAENVADDLAKSMRVNFSSPRVSCYKISSSVAKVTLYPFDKVVEIEDPSQPSGTGTLDDPYNALAAIDAVKDLTWTSNTEYETTDWVYVEGIISRIANKGTFTEGGTYGNASFYISEDGESNNEFYCFRVLYLENEKFEAGQTDIEVGDEVVVCAKLMNYKGNTPETVAGSGYLYSLNGATSYEPPVEYSITVNTSENGTVSASAATATEGTSITLTVTPATGYLLDVLTVIDADSSPVTVTDNVFTMPASNVTVSATFKERELEYPVTDVLTAATTEVTGNSYVEWAGKTSNSNAVYAGKSARYTTNNSSAIQLRSNGSDTGIVSTVSGGKVTKVTITWNEDTAEARVLYVYGSNTAYTAATDLYSTDTAGKLIGELSPGETVLEIDGEYTYIGFRSKTSALYLNEVDITWDK